MIIGMGISYYVGHSEDEQVKVDLFYTEQYIRGVSRTGIIKYLNISLLY